MIVVTYIVAAVACFITSTIAGWIPLAIMHGMTGNKDLMWEPDPGNERRFGTVHNWGQGVGGLLRTIGGMSAALWVFTLFSKEPNVIFFVAIGIWAVVSSKGAKPLFMPMAQLAGTIVGLIVFFLMIW